MVECQICGNSFRTVKSYVEHCRIHTNTPKVRLQCCFKDCSKSSPSYAGLRQHIARDHSNQRSNAGFCIAGCTLQCNAPSCTTTCNSVSDLIKHLQQHIREGACVECPMYGCTKKYSVRSSFACHLSRDHANWCQSQLKASVQSCQPQPMQSTLGFDCNSALDCNEHNLGEESGVGRGSDNDSDDDTLHDSCELESMKQDFIKNVSMFFLKLSTQFLIPDSTVELIAQEMLNINSLNQSYMKGSVCHRLRDDGIDEENIFRVKKAFDDTDLLNTCLEDGGLRPTKADDLDYQGMRYKL